MVACILLKDCMGKTIILRFHALSYVNSKDSLLVLLIHLIHF